MADDVCASCGERNAAGTEFCGSCHAFLGWDRVEARPDPGSQRSTPTQPNPTGPKPVQPDSPGPAGTTGRRAPDQRRPDHGPPADDPWATTVRPVEPAAVDPADGRLRAKTDTQKIVAPATGEPASLIVRVANASEIVDGYAVEAIGAPGWLAVEANQLRLFPGDEEALAVRLRVTSTKLIPAQQVEVVIRVRSLSWAPAHVDLLLQVVVPVVDAPVQLHVEPSLLRVRDRGTVECVLTVDNARSNTDKHVRLSGSDPELAVQYRFVPPMLDLGPGAAERTRVIITAPEPEPGQEISRSLTVTAFDGTRSINAVITLQQATTVRGEEPLVRLEVEPSLLRVRDSIIGNGRLVADNRGGTQWIELRLRAVDPERVVRVDWSQPALRVPPGGTAQIDFRLQAPMPDAGTEVSRPVTIDATYGNRTTTTTVTFVQTASVSPMETLGLRLDPAMIRVHDADSANAQVVVDNRRGRAGVRVNLEGSDPERIVRFGFSPPYVDVGPGQVQVVGVRVDAPRPAPGEESSRQLRVTATDGRSTVEASGSLLQTSSRAAIEVLGVSLDPSVLRLGGRRRGSMAAIVDNRNGAQPIRVTMTGDDPENAVRFRFTPTTLDVPPGRLARTMVSVEVPRGATGRELTRSITIAASDGRSAAQATGSLIQLAASKRPVARVLWTLFGAFAMIIGSLLTWDAVSGQRGIQIGLNVIIRRLRLNVDLGPAEQIISAGLVMIALAVLAIWGLVGQGRLTRMAAFLGVVLLVAVFVTLSALGFRVRPDIGALVALLGCIAAYIGGLLGRRR